MKKEQEKRGGKSNGPIVAEIASMASCDNPDHVHIRVDVQGGTAQEKFQAADELAQQFANQNDMELVLTKSQQAHREKSGKQFGPPSTWANSGWIASGSAWKKNRVN